MGSVIIGSLLEGGRGGQPEGCDVTAALEDRGKEHGSRDGQPLEAGESKKWSLPWSLQEGPALPTA